MSKTNHSILMTLSSTSVKLAEGHTIDDKIVQDTARSLSGLKAAYAVNGGMAVQTYLPSTFHRVSTDLDLMTAMSMSSSSFKSYIAPVQEILHKLGYQSETRTSAREHFDLQISGADGESFQLQTSKKSHNNFEKNRHKIEREISNATTGFIGMTPVKVLRPEDIILRKLMRVLRFEDIFGFSPIPKGDLQEQLANVRELRSDVLSRVDNLEYSDIARLRLSADLYDISAMLEHQNFDRKYFREGLSVWDYMQKNNERTKRVCIAINPKLAEF